jgi:hypothetical protein
LRGPARTRYEQWLARLKSEGCAALDYRLTGARLNRFCVRHLYGRWRAVVAFETARRSCIIALGQHRDDHPFDIYAQLYELLGEQVPTGRRSKPACCERSGQPATIEGKLDDLYDQARQFARRHVAANRDQLP